ncbi:MAG: hypothetical protein NT008_09200 [Methylococcales bacterium]|nr:hypothetical protein [Methylococcales bacterium]
MIIGLVFIAGIWSVISSRFIISTVFTDTAIYSNRVIRANLNS